MPEEHDTTLTIETASVLSRTKLLLELSDGRSIVLNLDQLLTLEPEVSVTEASGQA